MNLKKGIEWFPYIFVAYFALQQILVLISDPWAIKRTYLIFMNGPEFHNLTLLVLSLDFLALWYIFRKYGLVQRIEFTTIRLFCAVWFYEVIWHYANGIRIHDNYIWTWQWWFSSSDLYILNFTGPLTIVGIIILVITNCINKVEYKKEKTLLFSVLMVVFILCFTAQGLAGFDWSPLAIRYNAPVLWAITKIVGYSMWLLL